MTDSGSEVPETLLILSGSDSAGSDLAQSLVFVPRLTSAHKQHPLASFYSKSKRESVAHREGVSDSFGALPMALFQSIEYSSLSVLLVYHGIFMESKENSF